MRKRGIAVLTDLLSRYPVLASDVLTDDEPDPEIEPAELAPAQIVDLDEWFVPVAMVEPYDGAGAVTLQSKPQDIETAEAGLDAPGLLLCAALATAERS